MSQYKEIHMKHSSSSIYVSTHPIPPSHQFQREETGPEAVWPGKEGAHLWCACMFRVQGGTNWVRQCLQWLLPCHLLTLAKGDGFN